MNVLPNLVDPRGVALSPPTPAAPRLASLDQSRLLLIDNGKLGVAYGPYSILWTAMKSGIAEAQWRLLSNDLLRLIDGEVDAFADEIIRDERPDGVIVALADAGVSLQTSLLSVALEKRGVPTVVVATPLGARVVRAIFEASVPGLECIVFDTMRTDSDLQVAALVETCLGNLRRMLTQAVTRAATPADSSSRGIEVLQNWHEAPETIAEFQDWAESAGLGDGLPLLPPTERAIEALLESVVESPDEILYGPAPTSGRSFRMRDAAANAAMTACPPRAFPVVVAALRAMARPEYRLSQAAITTHPSGNAIIVSGAQTSAFALSSGAGCLGPGHRGNASVGRAVTLSVLSLFGTRPGGADLSIFGSPAEFTYCLAEAVDESPWPSLASEMGRGEPGVLVVKAESPRNVLEHLALTPEGVCEALAGAATSIGSNNAYVPGDLLLFINPEHARIFHQAGWGREDVAHAMYQMARVPRQRLQGHGVGPIRPPYMDALDELPVVRSPRDVHIVVAGAPGPQSMVALPWGYSRGQWQPIVARSTKL